MNKAGKAGRTSVLSITPTVPGATVPGTVDSVRVEVSYDNGASWHQQDLKQKTGTWRTSLRAPSSASLVSLRTTAKDRTGVSVTQTIIRAFGLK